jgi:hypothetical protein
MTPDPRRHAPAVARNRDPILAVLQRVLPPRGIVLEIASGTGEHITHFASGCSADLTWQPSDPDADSRASINGWADTLSVPNVAPALDLDASAATWPIASADAVLCINMIHISPWSAAAGLLRGAAGILPVGGLLYLYGPFRRRDVPMAASNEAFDADLRERNPAWGLRDLDAVMAIAASHGFGPPAIETMPANNLSVMFRRR